MIIKLREVSERKRNLDWDLSLRNPIFLQMYFVINEIKHFFTELPIQSRLKIYDLGCGTKPYEIFCENKEYVGVDIDKKNKQADIFASMDEVPVESESADIVVSFFALEHVPNPVDVIIEKYRLLKSGGMMFMLVPLYWEEHEQPYDYYRFTRFGIREILKEAGFLEIDIKAINSDHAILGMNLVKFFGRRYLRPVVPIINWIFMRLEIRAQRKHLLNNSTPSNVMSYAVRAVK